MTKVEKECVYLTHISGVVVETYEHNGQNYFQFKNQDKSVTYDTICTYKKARQFAKGICTGRRLEKGHHLSCSHL